MTANSQSRNLLHAVSRIRNTMSHADNSVADRMAAVCSQHIRTHRDDALADHISGMKRRLTGRFGADAKEQRILFITGNSDAGKSTLVESVIANDPAFQPYEDEDGVTVTHAVRFEAPSPCTLRNLAVEGLHALGFPVRRDMREGLAWPLFKDKIRQKQILFVFLDEAQHVINTNNEENLQKVRNTLKGLVQMDDWPVCLILSGVTPLETLREDEQIRRRSKVLHLPDLDATHARHVAHWARKVVTEHAGLEIEDFLEGDVPERIIRAGDGSFGSVVKLIRSAVEAALLDGSGSVGLRHFAAAYGRITGCSRTSNIFTAADWRTTPDAERPAAPERPDDAETKALRGGERRK